MENTLGLIGTIIGALGFALAVFVAVMQVQEQKRHAQERAEEKEMYAQERAEEQERPAHGLNMYAQEIARNERLMFLNRQNI